LLKKQIIQMYFTSKQTRYEFYLVL